MMGSERCTNHRHQLLLAACLHTHRDEHLPCEQLLLCKSSAASTALQQHLNQLYSQHPSGQDMLFAQDAKNKEGAGFLRWFWCLSLLRRRRLRLFLLHKRTVQLELGGPAAIRYQLLPHDSQAPSPELLGTGKAAAIHIHAIIYEEKLSMPLYIHIFMN